MWSNYFFVQPFVWRCKRIVWLSVLLLLLYGSSISYAQADTWETLEILFETPGRATDTVIVADSANILHVFWEYGAPGFEEEGAYQAIYYMRHDSSGWSNPVDILISPGGLVARKPSAVFTSDGRLHVVWSGGNRLFYSSANAAEALLPQAWSEPASLDSGVSILEPHITADLNDNLYIVWTRAGTGLAFTKSEDGGTSWRTLDAAFTASGNDELARYGYITTDDLGRLHIALTYTFQSPEQSPDPMQLYYLNSQDEGGTWSEPFLLVDSFDFGQVSLATWGEDVVHAVWNGRAYRRGRYHRVSYDGGVTWSAENEVVSPAIDRGGLTRRPALAVDSLGRLHMASGLGGSIHYFAWQEGRWSDPTLISPGVDGGGVDGASIFLNQGNQLHVLFQEGGERIWHTNIQIDAPPIDPQPLPVPQPELVQPTATHLASEPATPQPRPVLDTAPPPVNQSNSLIFSLLPTLLFVIGTLLILAYRRK